MAEETSYSAGDLNLSIQTISTDTLKSLDAVLERLTAINKGLTQVQSKTKRVNKTSANNTTSNEASIKTRKNTFLDIGKWTAVIYSAHRLGRIMANVVQMGADYGETLNLWQVAMGDYTEKATLFVNKMNEAYGISEKTLMNAQATFKNMLGSLGGLSDEMAYQLSESVTRMAIDYASLYNVGIEEAMTKFQAALAGQVRPIRSVSGYDITETTLYQLYESIGGTKTVRQLTQTEKRLLAIYAIFNQMSASGAIGDMQKTIGSFANQSRIMAESFDEVQSYLGLIITQSIETFGIMQGINAILAFTGEFFKGIANAMMAIKGQGSAIFDGTTDSANDASKAIDEVQGKLLGFDKFRSLSGSSENDISIDQALANAMAQYNSALNESTLGSKEIARNWLENIGLIYDAKTATYMVDKEFEGLYDTILIVSNALVGILTVLGTKGILTLVGKVGTKFDALGSSIKDIFSNKLYVGIMLIVAALYYMYSTNEDFREAIDNLFSVLSELLSTVLEPILGLLSLIMPIVAGILNVVAELLAPIINIVANVITFLDKAGALKGVLIAILGLFAMWTTLILAQNAAWLANPITWIVISIIAAVAILSTIISSVIKNFDEIKVAISNVLRSIGNFFHNIGAAIANWFIYIVNFCVDILNTLLKPLDWVIEALGGKGLQIPHWEAKVEYTPMEMFASGGLPDKGSMFIAGEAGAEYVYNMQSGQSGVANVQQIAQATYQGTMSALRDWWGGMSARNDIPQLQEANATGMYQAVTGVAKSYGEKWSNY